MLKWGPILVVLAVEFVSHAAGWGSCYNTTVAQKLTSTSNNSDCGTQLTPNEIAWFHSLGSVGGEKEASGTREWLKGREHNGVRMQVPLRRDLRMLTEEEKYRLKKALQKLRDSRADPEHSERSLYEVFITYHMFECSPAAHVGLSFLPWHREFLFRFERALQHYDPSVYLPYWDTNLDSGLPTPSDSVMWTEELVGNNLGKAKYGFGANWRASEQCFIRGGQYLGPFVNRTVGELGELGTLFTNEKINDIMSEKNFMGIGCKGCCFEYYHNLVHRFVGGHMGNIECAPNDPIFWMHHAFIDLLWEEFRTKHQSTDPQTDYPSTPLGPGGIGEEKHAPYSPMRPWPMLYNYHGLSDHYTNYYYKYAPRPSTCTDSKHCGSSYLWCNKGYCMSKVRENGNCTGLPDEACYGHNVYCIQGKCVLHVHPEVQPYHNSHPIL